MIVEELEWRVPLAVFAALEDTPGAHILQAGVYAQDSPWSVMVAGPVGAIELRGQDVYVDGARRSDDPLRALRTLLTERAQYQQDVDQARVEIVRLMGEGQASVPPFLSGVIGYVGYEAGHLFDPAIVKTVSPYSFADLWFGFYDAVLLFNVKAQRVFLVAHDEDATHVLRKAHATQSSRVPVVPKAKTLKSTFSQDAFEGRVSGVIGQILDGDYFQANLTQRYYTQLLQGKALDIFQLLQQDSDAPFGAMMQFEHGAILSNSPERFFKITPRDNERKIVTAPIKGTRPRSNDPQQDRILAGALLHDEKDRAENIMIADLMRNDLSKICLDESIQEEQICTLISVSKVHHLVSIISGVLQDRVDMVDVFKALFPCGSITGAPKIEAIKALHQWEGEGRGPYCGALGYIDDSGGADFSVGIRTMMVENDTPKPMVSFPAGGGITIKSNPHSEYQETVTKIMPYLQILGLHDKDSV